MTNSHRVLAIAAGEVGYSRWTDKLRGTKYARETQPVLWPRDTWLLANGIAFCDIFVTWVFWKAGALDVLPGRQSFNTDYRASAGRNAGALVTRAQARPGDVLVFDWNRATQATNHVGILEKVTAAGNPQSIEGNTSPGSSGSQGNGGGVYRRVRRWDQVRYIIRPDWAKLAPSIPAGGTSAPAAKPSTGKLAVDGKLGPATAKRIQKWLGVTQDGVIGPDTIRAWQRGHGTPVDGKITGQGTAARPACPAIRRDCLIEGSGGSKLIRAVQAATGLTGKQVDGKLGPDTVRALQRHYNRVG